MVKRPKYQQKPILDLSFLFTIKNVASGYTLCHRETEECSIPDKSEYTKTPL